MKSDVLLYHFRMKKMYSILPAFAVQSISTVSVQMGYADSLMGGVCQLASYNCTVAASLP